MKRIVRILFRNSLPPNQFACEANSRLGDLYFGYAFHCRHAPLCGIRVTASNLNIHYP